MSTLSDGGDEEEAQGCVNELPDELRTAICDHPQYPEMALAHIAILKVRNSPFEQCSIVTLLSNFLHSTEIANHA